MNLSKINRTTVISGAAFATVAVLGVATVGIAQAHKDATVEVDGTMMAISGYYPDVRSALNAAGVEIGQHDLVVPGLSERISDGQAISVARAQEYHVYNEGDEEYELKWSAASSLDGVANEVGVDASTGAIAVSRGTERSALPLTEQQAKATINVDGEAQEVEVAAGDTVDQILEKASVTVSPIDQVWMSTDSGDPVIEIKRSTRGYDTRTEEVAFEEQREEDPELTEGVEEIRQEGVVGERTIVTYQQTLGGETLVSKEISNQITTDPVAEVIAVGTKKPVENTTQTTSNSSTSSSSSDAGAVATGDVWSALAQCESGGNPSTNTGNGYYGMYQFSAGTWQAMGGSGLPSDASAEEQTAMAQKLQAQSGWGQWPGCASSLGLY